MSGFLWFARGSFMLDLVVVAMFLVIPIQIWSIRCAKQGLWDLHRRIQIICSVVLLIALVAFEVDIRINGWRHLAESSPFYESLVFPALYVHLCFAISTPFIWAYTLFKALKQFGHPVNPNDYLTTHKRWGKLSFLCLVATSVSGWLFYYLAFIAS